MLENSIGRNRGLRLRVDGDPGHGESRDGDQVRPGARVTVHGAGRVRV